MQAELKTVMERNIIEVEKAGGDSELIPFDTLILCTGAEYCGGVWRDDPVLASAKRQQFKNAESILVVGGGVTGIEAAGYLCEQGKKVGLVHRGDTLLKTIKGAHAKVLPHLKKIGVKVMLNTPYNTGDNQGYTEVLDCRGYKFTGPRSYMTDLTCISERGELKVNKFGQVASDPMGKEWQKTKLFSFGDISQLSPHVNEDGKNIV